MSQDYADHNSVVELSFNFGWKSCLTFELSMAFIMHVMYVRAVIPQPFSEIVDSIDDLLATPKLSSGDRQKLKAINEIQALLSSLHSLTQIDYVKAVSVLLGPSPNNPKEVYTLEFEPSDIVEVTGTETLSDREINLAKRHVIRSLIQNSCNSSVAPSPRTNIFIVVQTQGNDSSLSSSGGPRFQDDHHKQSVFQSFSYRDGFKIKGAEQPQLSSDSSNHQVRAATKSRCIGRRRTVPYRLCIRSKDYFIPKDGATAVGSSGGCGSFIDAASLRSMSCDTTTVITPEKYETEQGCNPHSENTMVESDERAIPVVGQRATESDCNEGGCNNSERGINCQPLRWLIQKKGIKSFS
jgi:hypothetical protein